MLCFSVDDVSPSNTSPPQEVLLLKEWVISKWNATLEVLLTSLYFDILGGIIQITQTLWV